ncbi:SDR family oxidoreductase [Sandaracinobacteroides sp. A072]|uniref:SDR family oxidoreductase n=1 Tax=Sandaracinobacteroides sp. A072 TaxID=3461146 RepID=UPI0040420F59
MEQLAGRVALVSGASKGMGRHFVSALVRAGMRVAALARPSAELDTLAAEHGEAVLAIGCDVSSPDAVNAAVTQAAARFGRIDVLVNNAAIFQPFAFEHGSDAIIRRHVDVNILGVSWLTRAAIPHLRKSQGQVISITSESVRMPFPMLALYAATKAAVETLSAGLRDELREDGIRVGILRSGSVSGGSGSAEWPAEARDAFFRKIVETGHAAMSGTPATPASMAEALVAMLSLPRDVSIDLVEVRASRSGVPEGARTIAGNSR